MQNNNITLRQARLQGREGLWQLTIENGRFSRIEPQDTATLPLGEVLDAEGGLAIPPFVEPHIHLDTTQTAGEPSWNQSGTLFEGIERWAERKAMLTHEDVKARAMQTLKWQMANGIQYVRTHVDVSDPTLTALKAMLEVKQEVAPWVELQIVAFPQEGILSYPNGEALLEEAVRLGADVIGAIPTLNLRVNMALSLCTKFSLWRRNTIGLSMCTATKLTMSSHALLKPSRRWRIVTIWANA